MRATANRRRPKAARATPVDAWARWRPFLGLATLLAFALLPGLAFGQEISIDFGDEATLTERAIQLIGLITVLALAPSILVMVTSFTRIVVVLSLLRTAIGLQTAPPNAVMVSLALFLTFFVMTPTLTQSYEQGVEPLLAGEISTTEAFEAASGPIHTFMRANVRERDLQLFYDLTQAEPPAEPEAIPLQLLIPAFMISELRRGFEIGFLIIMPFLVIDLIVATLVMSMGMMMLPPTVISLPFKILFFILIDGWNVLVGGLVRSFF